MQNYISHQKFYLWLANEIGVTEKDLPASKSEIQFSVDKPRFNDIPLYLWDRKDSIIRQKAHNSGIKVWSLCNTVCCLKAYAMNLIKE